MFEDTTIPGDGSSGTTVSQADSIHINSINAVNLQPELPEVPTKARAGGDEEALESHQVIELQIFSERKAWIEEKIKVRKRIYYLIQAQSSSLIDSFLNKCRQSKFLLDWMLFKPLQR